jgi:aryl-alcohol dehydrogenase-like predicted oxidoreductase
MIERQPFGRTGHTSTRVIFGAAALGGMSQARADATLELVRSAGINHIDTAASYGQSEVRLQAFLADHRSEFFLATKTGERTGAAARAELERSLERMGVDQVDLVQLHNLVEDDEWDVAHGAGGAVEALVQAREEGLVRFIGVTGHGTRIAGMHLRSLERFDFDSVLLPYNFTMLQDPGYRHDVESLQALCLERSTAVQTIKAVARRRWPDGDTDPHFSWYQALPEGEALTRAVAYVLGRPQVFLNTTSDARLLPAVFAAAEAVSSGAATLPSDDEMAADVRNEGISPLFDGGQLERI